MGAADAAATRTLLATEPGIALTGIQYDPQQHALFVAGSVSGKIFVYTLTASRPYEVARRAAVALARPRGRWQAPYVNDVAIGPSHVYATDSFEPFVHMIPRFSASNWVAAADVGGTSGGATYVHLGPGFVTTSARLNANGLVFARNNTLLVSNFDQSYVAAVQLPPGGAPRAQGEAAAAVVAARLPWVKAGGKGPWRKVWADSMVMGPGADTVYLSDNFEDRVLQLRLTPDLSSANVTCVISPRGGGGGGGTTALRAPTAMAFKDGVLWVLNARLLDCPFVLPCTNQGYEIVGVRPSQVCR